MTHVIGLSHMIKMSCSLANIVQYLLVQGRVEFDIVIFVLEINV